MSPKRSVRGIEQGFEAPPELESEKGGAAPWLGELALEPSGIAGTAACGGVALGGDAGGGLLAEAHVAAESTHLR
jgi:hypothetical protein